MLKCCTVFSYLLHNAITLMLTYYFDIINLSLLSMSHNMLDKYVSSWGGFTLKNVLLNKPYKQVWQFVNNTATK